MRPLLHLTPPAHWINDPTGLVRSGPGFRAFYQHADDAPAYRRVHWGTAWSPDLLKWHDHGIAIPATPDRSIYSGSVMEHGSALLAFYTAHDAGAAGRQRQAICLATSNDEGRSFEEHPGNPLIDERLENFRDPFVASSPEGGFAMLVSEPCAWNDAHGSTASRVRVYRSADLLSWTQVGTIGPWHAPGVLWEVPWVAPYDTVDGTRRWLLGMSLVDRRGGLTRSSTRAWIGTFNGRTFVQDEGEPAEGRLLDFGPDYYAATPARLGHDAASVRTTAWVGNWAYARRLPLEGFAGGVLAWPRRLTLVRGRTGGLQIRSRPCVDLTPRRGPVVRIEASVGKDESCALDVEALAHTCELDVEFEWLGAETVGVSLWDGELTFGLGAGGAERVLARAALESPRDGLGGFHGTWRSPRDESSSVARVRIWLDGCVAETSWDDGEAMASCLVFPRRRAGRAEFRAVGGAARCRLSACVLGEGARSGLGEFPQARGPSLEE